MKPKADCLKPFTVEDKKSFVIMRALCELAAANFPGETNIKITCQGKATGSVEVRPWTLIRLLDLAEQLEMLDLERTALQA
jgi:hypothetical protein